MPRAPKEVTAAKAAAKAATEAMQDVVDQVKEEAAEKRGKRTKPLPRSPGTPSAVSAMQTGNEEPIEVSEATFKANGETFDTASAATFQKIRKMEEIRESGGKLSGLHFNLAEEDRYAACWQRHGTGGHMKVRLQRMTFPEAELEDIPMRPYPALADVRQYIRDKHWDGREMVVHWECRSQRPGAYAQGDLKFVENPEAMARWEERKAKAEQRAREIATAATVPLAQGAAGAGVPGAFTLPNGMTVTPGGLQIAPGLSVPMSQLPPDIMTMLAQAALGKAAQPAPATQDPFVQLAMKALEAKMTAPAQVQQSPFGAEQMIAIIEAAKDKPGDQQMNALLLDLLKEKIKTPEAKPVTPEDPLDRLKKTLEIVSAISGGSVGGFGGQKKSELEQIIESNRKGKELAELLGFKGPGTDDDSGPVVKDKDGKIDGMGTVVKLAADNAELIAGGAKFLLEAGIDLWKKSKDEKRMAEERVIRARQSGQFAEAERLQKEADAKARNVELNQRYIEQLQATAKLEAEVMNNRAAEPEIAVREVVQEPVRPVTPVVTPAPVRPAPAPSAPAPFSTAADDDDLDFYPVPSGRSSPTDTSAVDEDDDEDEHDGMEAAGA
jgi:hypothetical protein